MRLIIVSNRLPITITEDDGRYEVSHSAGGVATGLDAFLRSDQAPADSLWVGWPGASFTADKQDEVRRLCRERGAHPVFLSEADQELYYEGFCNNSIWPLFHYFPLYASYEQEAWEAYVRVNQAFADEIANLASADDTVWIHDYHFLLLPLLLRQKRPRQRIGFFLHIPFPSYEMFRLLAGPWRTAILNGLLGADLIGFHTHDYTQYFLKCVRRILGLEHHIGEIAVGDRLVKVETFPMGVDFDAFNGRAASEEIARLRDEVRKPLGECEVVLSVDRLDYSKGIDNRLLAYQRFLDDNPLWRGRVVLMLVVVPSREGVELYRKMKSKIDELVGQINGRFGTVHWTPIVYQYKCLNIEPLTALYTASQVVMVTPLRDGMNLIAKEYLASRIDDTGVLVLSEMAGAASELGEAIQVNPNDIPGMAGALREALEMPLEAQKRAVSAMRRRLRRYNVIRWADDFLATLQAPRLRLGQSVLSADHQDRIVRDFAKARRRLVLCDYDGTLVPLRPTPDQATPTLAVIDLIERLSKVAEVVIVSGRDRNALENWFGNLDVGLVAEHGVWTRRHGEWLLKNGQSLDWKTKVRELMELYVDRLPGAFIEEKEHSIAWHYRRADPDLASVRVKELTDTLISLTENGQANILEGSKVIEVRPSGVGKGAAASAFLFPEPNFVLALGDDSTDEDLFKAMPRSAQTIRVGLTKSQARYSLYSQSQAVQLLESLAACGPPPGHDDDTVVMRNAAEDKISGTTQRKREGGGKPLAERLGPPQASTRSRTTVAR
jgi:trehalose 6-phosphate synthase/phosphatase